MPLLQTSGNVTADGYGGGVAAVPQYIEDVFSTYLYTGTGSSQTITNNIDLSGKGGLTWIKTRGTDTNYSHILTDTVRGATKALTSNTTDAEVTSSALLSAFTSSGFTVGTGVTVNKSGNTLASWTFRKQPKFFDVVTYTGNGTGTSIGGGVLQRDIAHSLTSTPGCVIIKNLDTSNWVVYHRSSAFGTENLRLNTTGAGFNASGYAPIYAVSDTTFSVIVGATGLSSNDNCNINGASYVAYVFAHNAGGFGLTGTDNVISCGSFTTDASGNANVTLGYEPQYILMKKTSGVQNWVCYDTMRGWAQAQQAQLYPNITQAEDMYTGSPYFFPTATGFSLSGTFGLGNNDTFIYIAIRRGPMKVPTSGTSVYETVTSSASAGTVLTTGFPVDLQMQAFRSTTGAHRFMDRLRGVSTNSTAGSISLASTSDAAETSTGSYSLAWNNTGFQMTTAFESTSGVFWNFGRAPSFFDEVCYTGTGSATTVTHNLGVAPELMIVKQRSSTTGWVVYSSALAASDYLVLNNTSASQTASTIWNSTAPTASVFSVGTSTTTNTSAGTYVAYLFATCAGVSKVGSYTGNGSTQTINCGFTGGARFVLIKRTDSTGNWYVYDTARGMTTLVDPYLLLNSTAAESATLGSVTTVSTGFAVNASILAAINTNGASYIFLAIA